MNKTRFITRHILRNKAKTTLTILVAAVFVFFLGFLEMSIANMEDEVDWLYLNTFVNAEIRYNPLDDPSAGSNRIISDFIPRTLVEDMFAQNLVHTYYLETGHANAAIGGIDARLFGVDALQHFTQNPDGFVGRPVFGLFAGGGNMAINFAPGFDYHDFKYDNQAPQSPIPIVIPPNLSGYFALGELVSITYSTPAYPEAQNSLQAQIIGIHDNGNLAADMMGAIIMPSHALQTMLGPHLGYRVFRFTINPIFNREFNYATEKIEQLLSQPRPPWDTREKTLFVMSQELRLVVEPMAQNLDLLRLLHPIAIIVAAIISLTLAAIVLLQSTKNAAIMRALGITKSQTAISLSLEYLISAIIGTMIGIAAAMMVRGYFNADAMVAALPYFLGAAVGAVGGAVYIAGRPPLELLQVRE